MFAEEPRSWSELSNRGKQKEFISENPQHETPLVTNKRKLRREMQGSEGFQDASLRSCQAHINLNFRHIFYKWNTYIFTQDQTGVFRLLVSHESSLQLETDVYPISRTSRRFALCLILSSFICDIVQSLELKFHTLVQGFRATLGPRATGSSHRFHGDDYPTVWAC